MNPLERIDSDPARVSAVTMRFIGGREGNSVLSGLAKACFRVIFK
jgi:hypothetical protein